MPRKIVTFAVDVIAEIQQIIAMETKQLRFKLTSQIANAAFLRKSSS